MRKISLFIASLASVLFLASCEKKELVEVPSHTLTFTAGVPSTKTSFEVSGSDVIYSWSSTDANAEKFQVWENGNLGTTTSAVLGNDGCMKITATFASETAPANAKYKALFNKAVLAEQTSIDDEYDQDSDVLVSNEISDLSTMFSFKREVAFGYVQLNGLSSGDFVGTVTIESDKDIAGVYDMTTGEWKSQSKTITITALNEIENGVAYLRFVSLPVEDATLKMTVTTVDDNENVVGTFVKQFTKTISFAQGDVRAFAVTLEAPARTKKSVLTTFKSGSNYTAGMMLPYVEGLEWISSGKPNGFESASPARGIQFSATSSTLSTEISDALINRIVVVASSNSAVNSISAAIGGTSIGTSAISKTNNTEYVFSSDTGLSGKVEVNLIAGTSGKSIYVKSILIEYFDTAGGQENPGTDPEPEPEEIEHGNTSISDFLDASDSDIDWYTLTGKISNLSSGDLYGNFTITDATGSVYVYGVRSEKNGEPKKFQELAAAQGIVNDGIITITANRGTHNDTKEAINAYFVSYTAPSSDNDTDEYYVKATSIASGKYLMVYEAGSKVAVGALASNKIASASVEIDAQGRIKRTAVLDLYRISLVASSNNYFIQLTNDWYLGNNSGDLVSKSSVPTESAYKWTITEQSDGTHKIVNAGTTTRRIGWNGTDSFKNYATSSANAYPTLYVLE